MLVENLLKKRLGRITLVDRSSIIFIFLFLRLFTIIELFDNIAQNLRLSSLLFFTFFPPTFVESIRILYKYLCAFRKIFSYNRIFALCLSLSLFEIFF